MKKEYKQRVQKCSVSKCTKLQFLQQKNNIPVAEKIDRTTQKSILESAI